MSPYYLTTSEAAERLGISPEAVRAAIRRGTIPATVFGSFWAIAAVDLEHLKVRKPGRPFSQSPRCPCGVSTLRRAQARGFRCCRDAGLKDNHAT